MRIYANRAVFTTLSTGLAANGAETTIAVGDTTGWPAPGAGDIAIGAIDVGDQGLVEIFSYTGLTATSFTGVLRGQDGTTQPAHAVGAKVRHVTSATDIQSIGAKQALSEKGAANGYAPLGSDSKVPAANLPASSMGDLLDWQYVRKTADEAVTSSITLQDDDHLLLAIGANQTWVLEFVLFVKGDAAADFQLTVAAPTGAGGRWGMTGPSPGTTGVTAGDGAFGSTTLGTERVAGLSGTTATGEAMVVAKALVRNGGTAGNATLRWAQSVSSATATTLMTDSYLIATRVA